MGTVKCVGILTSGGDAPGMNAAIRAVTRAAIYNGLQVKGIYRGYKGLVTGEISEFKSQNVSNIIQLGGTILKTARCKEFTTPEGRQLAYENMKKEGIDALVIIGGDGSLTGARICTRVRCTLYRIAGYNRQRLIWYRYHYRIRYGIEHYFGCSR